MITVQDILASKPQADNVIAPSALVIDALKELNNVNLSYLIVKDNGTFKGVFSERDYTRNLVLKGRSSRDTMVGEVMTTDLKKVDLDTDFSKCMSLMASRGTRYLLAVDGNEFAGIITIHDLLRQILSHREEIFDSNLAEQLLQNDEGARIY